MAMADPGELTRRERRKAEVRARILAAAAALFDEQGFAATKVTEIAERADVAHKTFFNHFPAKQDVLRQLTYVALDSVLEQLETSRKFVGTTRERVLHFFDQIAANAEAAGPMRREMVTELIHALHDARDESRQVKRMHDAFAAIVTDGIEAGEIHRDRDPQALTNVVMGTFYSLMFNWAHLDEYPLRQQSEAAARVVADALLAAPSDSNPALET